MILSSKFKLIALNNSKIIRLNIPTHLQTVQFIYQVRTVASQPEKLDIIKNLQKNLGCSIDVATNIYSKFPSLRSLDAVENDKLKLLRFKNVSAETIVENPSLLTSEIDALKRKIVKIDMMEPKEFNDFAPLLALSESVLNRLSKLFQKEKMDIEEKNRIYYLSKRFRIEPHYISKYIAEPGYMIFGSSFRSFVKKINILLDYGMSQMEILNGLYALCYSDGIFVRRCEQCLLAGKPVKISYFLLPETDFDERIKKHTVKKDTLPVAMLHRLEKHTLEKAQIVETLKSLLNCNNLESSELYYDYISSINELATAKNNAKYLMNHKITPETIRQNGFLLQMSIDDIKKGLEILRKMQPKNMNDFIPLMIVDISELQTYKCKLESEQFIGNNHPIYYFSEKLNIPASKVADRFGKRSEVFLTHKTDILKLKLDVLVKHDVDRESILNCKLTFMRYSAKRIEEIIYEIKRNGVDHILSYMIHNYRNPKVDKLKSNRIMERNSLEGFENSMKYIAHRLNWNESDHLNVLKRYPKLKNCSARKIKTHLDYLLNEAKFTTEEIKNTITILSCSLDEIKSRLKEMKEIGAPIKLRVIALSKNRYLKYIQKCSS
ncbi:uncharacterized protein LOC116338226 [Contarinia nasturtii]|uniref:uncharacterized protein LOC116338226 n=1 Tax=Contarinia nasturtii TaxID=265458 RepID=UPI0012D44BF1|nr:uncharacterized protein LOC116338226 [Contarinia nasturtii]